MSNRARTRIALLLLAAVVAVGAWATATIHYFGERQAPTKAIAAEQPTRSATLTPPQISMTQEVLDKMIADAIAKAPLKPTPQPVFTPDPTIMANVSEEGKLREGFILADPAGKKFMRIYRRDNHPVTEGLTPDNVAIETWKQPIYTNMGDGTWDIVFKERNAEEIKPNQPATPTTSPTPTPSITERP